MIRATIRKFIKEKFYKGYLNNKGHFSYYGEKVFFPKNSVTFESAMASGIYERENLQFIVGNVTANSVYLDIGANIGLMSIPLLKTFNDLRVVSVEASPATFSFLKTTQENSSCKDRWHILNKAVSNVAGEIDFYVTTASEGAFDSIKNTNRTDFSSVIKVPAVTIDEIWNDLKQPHVSFIKSDIEGADLLGIKGAVNCIAHCKPVILLEWNRLNIVAFGFTHADLLEICKVIGYRCYAVPSLVRVNDALELQQHTQLTENYMLLPGN